MKIYEIGTGYTSIPATKGAATEIVVEELTRAFRKNKIPVELVDKEDINRGATELPIIEVKVPALFSGTDVKLGLMHKLNRVFYSLSLAGTLRQVLKKTQDTVLLHFHNQYNLYFFLKLVPRKLRKRAVVAYTVHSYIWHGLWDDIKETIRKRYFQEVYCVEHADRVFVLNSLAQNNMVENLNVDRDRIHMIDNGVNLDVYAPISEEQREECRKKWNLVGKRVFANIGSVCDRKNQLEAVRMLGPLLRENSDMVFCYAGGIIEPEYQDAVLEYAREQEIGEQVRYYGELRPGEELNAFYNLAEAMIFPSKAEGFSLVVLEAMAAGLPVVVRKDLEYALASNCLRYADEKDFLNIIQESILDPNNRMTLSERSRETVMSSCSWERVAQTYLAECCGWREE